MRVDHEDANVIDIRGRTLMPDLIDAHAHITGLSLSPKNIFLPNHRNRECRPNYLRCSLMDGFTSIREAGGADHRVARLLAEEKIVGPRLFYSGSALTQTGGGADFRSPDETVDPAGQPGPFSVMSVIADGVDEVRKAAREELRRGAAQIKVFVSGGVVFPSEAHPTIYEYSLEELHAIVEEAKGSRHLRHGPRLYRRGGSAMSACRRTLNRTVLMQSGNLGVIAPAAYADLLVVEGDHLSDMRVMADPQKNLKLIMKDGVVYKNEL
jgi:imidazolonepropionase-like amidohydrolase